MRLPCGAVVEFVEPADRPTPLPHPATVALELPTWSDVRQVFTRLGVPGATAPDERAAA